MHFARQGAGGKACCSSGWPDGVGLGCGNRRPVRRLGRIFGAHLCHPRRGRGQELRLHAVGGLAPELWATPVPFCWVARRRVPSCFLSALRRSDRALRITGISTGIIAWTNPPSGLWYVSMVLTEQAGASGNGGYAVLLLG